MGMSGMTRSTNFGRQVGRLFLLGLSLIVLTTMLAAAAQAQTTPFDSQYDSPTGPPPTDNCGDGNADAESNSGGDPGTEGSTSGSDCNEVKSQQTGSPQTGSPQTGDSQAVGPQTGSLQVLPATGGLASLPFSTLAPVALLGIGIVGATGVVVIRRRR